MAIFTLCGNNWPAFFPRTGNAESFIYFFI